MSCINSCIGACKCRKRCDIKFIVGPEGPTGPQGNDRPTGPKGYDAKGRQTN